VGTARFTARINTYPFPADAALPLGPVQQEQARRIPAGPDLCHACADPRTTDRHAVAGKQQATAMITAPTWPPTPTIWRRSA